jgi:hypothetical protein
MRNSIDFIQNLPGNNFFGVTSFDEFFRYIKRLNNIFAYQCGFTEKCSCDQNKANSSEVNGKISEVFYRG